MNANDIFRKSDLGRKEIKNQGQGVLPREVRTLLILIDGKKTYQHYIDSLDGSSMFAEFGGVAPLFELLIDFQCIERVEPENANTSTHSLNPISKPSAPRQVSKPKAVIPPVSDAVPIQRTPDNDDFEKTFNTQSSMNSRSAVKVVKESDTDANYEPLKSDLATHIEKNAPPEEAWGHLLNLEQCRNTSQLVALARDIQNSNSVTLARSMNEFFSRMNRSL